MNCARVLGFFFVYGCIFINFVVKERELDNMNDAALYLFPVGLSDTLPDNVLPQHNLELLREMRYLVVENIRTARRFLKSVDKSIDVNAIEFTELSEHTDVGDIPDMLAPLSHGESVGLLSEAGCPAVADPGSDLVAAAQRRGYKVVPLVGPSSILLSLMGSGFNGQSFAFMGYLPIDESARVRRLKDMQRRVVAERQTQIFIETPYRNHKMVEDILQNCRPQTKLCIAANITCEGEYIQTRTVKDWKGHVPDLSKIPCIFLLYK